MLGLASPLVSVPVRVVAAAPDPGGSQISGTTGAVFVIGVLVALVLSIAIFFGRGRQQRVSRQKALGDDVAIGLRFLAEQLEGIEPAASQAAADAWNRLTAARAIVETGDSEGISRAARHALLEGLAAAYVARGDAGLEPGPVPPPPSDVPVVPSEQQVTVDGRISRVLPAYRPGFVHHFPGGRFGRVLLPGGWYAEPLWEGFLLPPGPSEDER
jgi:hypothetical protein